MFSSKGQDIVTSKRILIATDIPFWRASTGAQQRIRSLVNCLIKQDLQIRVFFIASDNAAEIRDEIQGASELDAPNLTVEVNASSDPPKRLGPKLVWPLANTLNTLSPKQAKPSVAVSPTLRLGGQLVNFLKPSLSFSPTRSLSNS